MKVVILCGGQGTRIRDVSELVPKPMIEIGNDPIIAHIMKTYAHYGHNEFILCLGYKGNQIKRYFLEYELMTSDFTIELGTKDVEIHKKQNDHNWKVTLVDTGVNAMTGARVRKIREYIGEDDLFLLTYGDGVSDIDINKLIEFHKSHGKIGTVTGVFPPSRYGELVINGSQVTSFAEKPTQQDSSINGGYFVFGRKFFDYLDDREDLILERDPLEKLTNDGELQVYQHQGFWQCMDTFRDYKYLTDHWESGDAPWKVW